MSDSNLIAGAILVAVGAILTVTGIGALIGIPLGLLGFGVMFPRFTKVSIYFAVLGTLLYLVTL